MKLRLVVELFAVMSLCSTAHADDTSKLFEQARARYDLVERAVPKLRAMKRDLNGYSLEGGELTAYFQNGAPRKMVARHFGEGGRATDELYFWDGRLFFVLATTQKYEKRLGENGAPGKTRQTARQRFYFANGHLWRWIDESGRVVESGAALAQQEKQQLQFAREMLTGARANAQTINASAGH